MTRPCGPINLKVLYFRYDHSFDTVEKISRVETWIDINFVVTSDSTDDQLR